MTIRATKAMTVDPLAVFINRATCGKNQIPLVSSEYDLRIGGGLTVVTATRIFRNDEDVSIEAVVTFPVPVHATVFSLKAKIDNRVLMARAERKNQAREKYEKGLAAGKSSILHEELLRGIHMLSVGHIGPGKVIEVIIEWAMPLTVIAGQPGLRIPLTVGQVYGMSGLPDSDELASNGPNQNVRLSIACDDGPVTLVGGTLIHGQAFVPLNAPIDLLVPLWETRTLVGVAAGGRSVEMTIKPIERKDVPIHAAILVDHSGSMAGTCSSETGAISKHEALKRGLSAAADMFNLHDRLDLFEFDHAVRKVGVESTGKGNFLGQFDRSVRKQFAALVEKLSDPSGGTEIGQAISHVITDTIAKDILVITDGKSHEIDVQKLARCGRRINVVLVGQDSLEAHIGHLAALTGGQIFVSGGHDLTDVIATALDSLRTEFGRPDNQLEAISKLTTSQGGVEIVIKWGDRISIGFETEKSPTGQAIDRAVPAVAAQISLPNLSYETAVELARAEGLVTHLTSLILVDEDGETHDGVPEFTKVPLARPADVCALPAYEMSEGLAARPSLLSGASRVFDSFEEQNFKIAPRDSSLTRVQMLRSYPEEDRSIGGNSFDVAQVTRQIDWIGQSGALLKSDLSGTDPEVSAALTGIARRADVSDLAKQLGTNPILLTLLLFALSRRDEDRFAGRFARHLMKRLEKDEVEISGALARLMMAIDLPLPHSLIEFADKEKVDEASAFPRQPPGDS